MYSASGFPCHCEIEVMRKINFGDHLGYDHWCHECGKRYKYDGVSLSIEYGYWGESKDKKSLKNKIPKNISSKSLSTPLNQLNEAIAAVETQNDKQIYEESYWKYVNSTTTEDALYWFNQMISKVNMDLEPAGKDWKSWVSDPADCNKKAKPWYEMSTKQSIITWTATPFLLAGIFWLIWFLDMKVIW